MEKSRFQASILMEKCEITDIIHLKKCTELWFIR